MPTTLESDLHAQVRRPPLSPVGPADPQPAGPASLLRLRSWRERLMTPGGFAPTHVLIASIAAMLLLGVIDGATEDTIRLQVLYVFPLAVLALHADRLSDLLVGMGVSIVLQAVTVIAYDTPLASKITDTLVALTSSGLAIVLARKARNNYLAIEQMATIDSLTGLRNRRGFEAVASLELAIQRRYGGWFSIALLDLDQFKALNDTLGHAAGDRALRLLGELLVRETRSSDLTARLGGDEFVVMMPNTIESECNVLCRKLAQRIAQRMREAGYELEASVGRATFHRPPDSIAEALAAADRSMYSEKSRRKADAAPGRGITRA